MFLLLFLMLDVCTHAQIIITGKVLDSLSGSPITNASIYLNGSTSGTTSNQDGEFILRAKTNNIPLVVSHLGYESETIIKFGAGVLIIKLLPKISVLEEVTIGPDRSRDKELAIFLREFIGTPAGGCYISNTEDLNFNLNKKTKTLTATADRPLQLVNKRTGYKITYFLNRFLYSDSLISFRGHYFFEEDTAGLTPEAIQKILKTRESYYRGSKNHFIRSLWADQLKKDRFEISKGLLWQGEINYGVSELPIDSVVSVYQNKKYITYKKMIRVEYRDNHEKASFFKIEVSKGAVEIYPDGNYYPELTWGGEFALQRIAKLLPYEYRPAKDISPAVKER